MPFIASLLLAASLGVPRVEPTAAALIDSAIARMGGRTALENVSRLHIEGMTEWYRTVLDDRMATPVSSFERFTEWRDYTRPAWRYVRRFAGPTGWQEIVDVVTDTAAIIRSAGKWGALSVAYVDERNELFATSPERVLLLARRSGDARLAADTTILGRTYKRIRVSLDERPATLLIDRATMFPAVTHLRAGQVRDFGLAPWGEMDVEFRYSRWSRNPSTGLSLPTQIDVYRVGRPYKRMVWLGVNVNPVIPEDSLTISDSLRAVFLATQNRAMHDLPVDTARIVDGRYATFGTPGTPRGALKLGNEWLLFEAGTAPLSAERSAAFLAKNDPGSRVSGCLALDEIGSGGLAWCARQKVPIFATPLARPYVDAALRGWDQRSATVRSLAPGRALRIGGHSIVIATLDLPDYPGSAMVYVPSQRWLFASLANRPLQRELILAAAAARGWTVERLAAPGGSFAGTKP